MHLLSVYVCPDFMRVPTQGPEQQQHQHVGLVHLQQHDSTSYTVSYCGNAHLVMPAYNTVYVLIGCVCVCVRVTPTR